MSNLKEYARRMNDLRPNDILTIKGTRYKVGHDILHATPDRDSSRVWTKVPINRLGRPTSWLMVPNARRMESPTHPVFMLVTIGTYEGHLNEEFGATHAWNGESFVVSGANEATYRGVTGRQETNGKYVTCARYGPKGLSLMLERLKGESDWHIYATSPIQPNDVRLAS